MNKNKYLDLKKINLNLDDFSKEFFDWAILIKKHECEIIKQALYLYLRKLDIKETSTLLNINGKAIQTESKLLESINKGEVSLNSLLFQEYKLTNTQKKYLLSIYSKFNFLEHFEEKFESYLVNIIIVDFFKSNYVKIFNEIKEKCA